MSNIEINFTPHPTDSLLVCDECGESYAGAADVKAMADWMVQHCEWHNREEKP